MRTNAKPLFGKEPTWGALIFMTLMEVLTMWFAIQTVVTLETIKKESIMLGYAENVGGWHWKASIVDFEKGNP